MSKVIIGLTGGIASGKSEVARRFARHGITVVDADTVAREVVAPGTPALQEIVDHLGHRILLPDGQLDRAALRRHVFADPAHRQWLEGITHPAIRQSLMDQCQRAESPYAIAAIPLLAEAGRERYRWLARIVVVDVPEAVQLVRLRARDGIDDALARQMIAAQATREQRRAIADHVIDNSGPPEGLDAPVSRLHAEFLGLAGQRPPSG